MSERRDEHANSARSAASHGTEKSNTQRIFARDGGQCSSLHLAANNRPLSGFHDIRFEALGEIPKQLPQ